MISTNFIKSVFTSKNLVAVISFFFVIVFPLLIIYSNDLTEIEQKQSFCPFKLLTGFPCPGCGITKSLAYLYTGELRKSFHFHLFGPFLIFGLFAFATVKIVAKRELKIISRLQKKEKIVATLLAISLGIYHFYRLVIYIQDNNIDSIIRASVWR